MERTALGRKNIYEWQKQCSIFLIPREEHDFEMCKEMVLLSSSAYKVLLHYYIGVYPICRDEGNFSRWRSIWKFSNAYIFALLLPTAL